MLDRNVVIEVKKIELKYPIWVQAIIIKLIIAEQFVIAKYYLLINSES